MSFLDFLYEQEQSTIAITFGRLNPPTIGHLKLMDAVKAANPKNYRIYLSHTQDPKKNPLTYEQKLKYAKEMFPKHKKNIIDSSFRTIFEVAVGLYNEGIRNLILVVGSDRVPEFEKTLVTYNGKEARHGFYKFDTLKIVSAGERDPDSDGVEGMSASKLRAAVLADDKEEFAKGMPKGYNFNELYNDIKEGLKQ